MEHKALEYKNDNKLARRQTGKAPNWQDAKLASTPQKRWELEREVQALLWKDQEIAHKERQAQRAERIYLEEDVQEKKILRQKMEPAKREDANFQEVEKEYETDVELVKEREEKLSLLKQLTRKRKCCPN